MIPRVLHRVVPAEVPDRFEEFWCRWSDLHPDWELRTWRDPLDPADWELGWLHGKCTAGAQLAGLVRLEVIYRFGGVYVDMDVEPVRPFDELLDNECFIGTEGHGVLTDAVFGAVRHHPAIRACIDLLACGYWSSNPSDTGPLLTTRMLSGRDDVTVLPQAAFYPYRWDQPETDPQPGTFAVHRWNHSWKAWNQ